MIKNKLYFNKADFSEIKAYEKRMNEELENKQIGYYYLPEFGEEIINQAKLFLKDKEYKDVVLVGIGGSSLGVRALLSALESTKKPNVNFHFLDNLDCITFSEIIEKINFKDSLFIIASKSGTTIETITLFKCILNIFSPKTLNENFIVITDENSVLEKFAQKNNIEIFHIPSNVGGRFSVLSAVGIVPMVACGYNVDELLDGAKSCKNINFDNKDDTILQKAYHYVTHKSATINVLFSYCDKLSYFNDWYVQLWAESLGKRKGYKRIGLTPVGLVGSRDQHSFLQLIIDGVKDKTVTFIKVLDKGIDYKIPNTSLEYIEKCDFVNNLSMNELMNYQFDATFQALKNEGISVDMIEIDKIDEWHIGYLMYYYELLTSAVGLMYGIDTYNQPGVEVGKKLLNIILKNKI